MIAIAVRRVADTSTRRSAGPKGVPIQGYQARADATNVDPYHDGHATFQPAAEPTEHVVFCDFEEQSISLADATTTTAASDVTDLDEDLPLPPTPLAELYLSSFV